MAVRTSLLSVIAVLSLVTTLFGSPLEKELLSREREFITAIKQDDQPKMKDMLADGACSVVPEIGRQTREQMLNRLANTALDRYEIDDVKAIGVSKDVGILSFKYSWAGSPGKDGEQVGTYYSTSTWVRQEGEWKVIFYQQTRWEE